MIPYSNKRAGVSEQENQEQAEISSNEDNPIHEIIEDEVIDINSGVSAIAKSISNCIIPETIIYISNANHPDVKNIRVTIHGTRKLNFQTKWFKLLPWLNWDISIKKMICYLCSNLTENQQNTFKCTDLAYISKGYLNWKKQYLVFQITQSLHYIAMLWKYTTLKR